MFLYRNGRVPFDDQLAVAQTYWSGHLLASPPSDVKLMSLLRKLTPWSDLDVSFGLHTKHASRIVEWLKVFRSAGIIILARFSSHNLRSVEILPWILSLVGVTFNRDIQLIGVLFDSAGDHIPTVCRRGLCTQ